jgi:large subunit ribosomal protein L25
MARHESTALKVTPREPGGSRTARRLRREGNVPGVVYGGGDEAIAFQVPARLLRNTLAGAGAVLDLDIEGSGITPVVVKDLVRHPVHGRTVHVDLLRVRMDVKIQSTVLLELIGADDAPGVREDGGVLEHITRELTIEALPGDIPDSLTHDVSGMQIGDTLMLDALRPPAGIELVDDPETMIATLIPPRLQVEGDDEIEQETQVVGEGQAKAATEEAAEGASPGAAADSDAE